MKEIILPVHPITRAIILHETGRMEPVVLRNHDPIFGLFTVRRIRPNRISRQVSDTLSANITVRVDDAIARHCIEHASAIGITLYRLHKDTMCRYVQAALLNGTPALYALRQFYHIHGITEDDYMEESAWKAWMRWSKTREKKRHFFARSTGNVSPALCKKRDTRATAIKPQQQNTWTLSEINIELAAARFLSAYSHTFRHTPSRLSKHIRIYLYSKQMHLSCRQVAVKVGCAYTTCAYACRLMEARARKNHTIARLLADCIALPTPA